MGSLDLSPAPQAVQPPTLVLGFPRPALVIFAVEFAERLGYYAVAFSLFTYQRHVLGYSAGLAQATTNGIYTIVPLAAFFSSALSDGRWGRPKTLMVFLAVYAASLTALTFSSLPLLFREFPEGPTFLCYALFSVAVLMFATGYGGMKVCTNPMMADSITVAYAALLEARQEEEDGSRASRTITGGSPSQCADDTHLQSPSGAGQSGVYGSVEDTALAVEKGGAMGEVESSATLANTTVAVTCTVSPQEEHKWVLDKVLSRAFSFIYWVSNLGSLFGIFAAPLMRNLDSRRVSFGSDSYAAGYYYGFAMASLSVWVGLVFFSMFRRQFPRNELAPPLFFFRLVGRAIKMRFLFAIGKIHDPVFQCGPGRDDFLAYGTYSQRHGPGSGEVTIVTVSSDEMGSACGSHVAVPGSHHPHPRSPRGESVSGDARLSLPPSSNLTHREEAEETDDSSDARRLSSSHSDTDDIVYPQKEGQNSTAAAPGKSISSTALGSAMESNATKEALGDSDTDIFSSAQLLAECRVTLRVCRAFVALPVYWLISNQYSSSLMFSIEALNLPASIPPDLFNNINTFTLLLFIALCDRVIYPRFFERRGHALPSPRVRIVVGFLLVVLSMIWCGVVQVFIARRGVYVGAEGQYEVRPGATKMSAGWLVMPYVLQGVAAALVDPASMEVAYTDAPDHMKGTVMAMYWISSSVSGVLGLVLSPVMLPNNAVVLYFSFAGALLLVTMCFYRLNFTNRVV